jgi:hypothetical protein
MQLGLAASFVTPSPKKMDDNIDRPSQRPPETYPLSILPSPVITFCFCKTAAYTVKLAATTMLSLLSYLLPCGHRCATTAYKLNKK